jgi:fumarate hydratase subunit alpha
MASDGKLVKSLVSLIREAETDLPADVESALRRAYREEKSEIARTQLKEILRNVEIARKKTVPICQDTGILNFYVKIGKDAKYSEKELREAINEAAKTATKKVPLRQNSVDPLSRKSLGENIPVIEFEEVGGKTVDVTVLPKGAGSDNMTRLCMLPPSRGLDGIRRFVLESVAAAGGKACPPTIVCVGIGGSSDAVVRLAKKALLRKVGQRNKDKELAALEEELEEKINGLGIGPMGLGGKISCLTVNIETAPCHTGSLPVAVNLGCWALRRATGKIK